MGKFTRTNKLTPGIILLINQPLPKAIKILACDIFVANRSLFCDTFVTSYTKVLTGKAC